MSILNFDASTVAPDTGVTDPVPAGWYNVTIDESELKPTKGGDGQRLSLRFNILDGQYANRKVFTGLNLRNPNPVAQEIALKQLSAICHAVGVLQVAESQQLHGRPLKIRVKVRAASGDYEASNDITAFKNINEHVEGQAAAANPAQGAPWGAAPITPPPQFAAPVPPMPQAAAPMPAGAPAWQAPAAPQPWAAAPVQQPAQAPQQMQPIPPQMQPAAQPAQAAMAQNANPPWVQQAPGTAPTGAPPWGAPAQQ